MADTPTTIGDLMSAPVQTVEESKDIQTAARLMADSVIGSLVVLGSDGGVSGILSERDVLRATAAGASQQPLASWMTASPEVVEPDVTPMSALEMMNDRGFRHLPVVDGGGGLVGLVSMRDLLSIARIEPVTHPGQLEAPRGLAGVIVAETEVGDVRGQEGFFHYREYSAVELARKRSIEDVWHLMLRGGLPSRSRRDEFAAEVAELRFVPERTRGVLPAVAETAEQPLDGLRTAISLTAAELGFQPSLDVSPDELAAQALRITAVIPTLVMALYRLGRGDEPVAPDPDLGYVENYLKMMTGEAPDPAIARALEQYMMLTVDHGFNASTFTGRVITSTGADLGAALVGALGALSGPLHGGAPSRALDLVDEIGSPDRAESVIREKVEAGQRIMGFGHRVYKTRDPRSELLREVALRLGGERAELAAEIEQKVVDVLAELKPGRELYANVEFFAGVVFEQVDLPPSLFTPTFAASRSIGWCAHVLEQAGDNRLIRPTARYIGKQPPAEVPDVA